MSLSLQPTALSVLLAVLVMAAGVWMSRTACKRNRRPLTFKLELLRLVILGGHLLPALPAGMGRHLSPAGEAQGLHPGGPLRLHGNAGRGNHPPARRYPHGLRAGADQGQQHGIPERHARGGIRRLRLPPSRRIPRITPWPARTWPSRWKTPCNPRTTCGRSSCSRTAATTPPPPC